MILSFFIFDEAYLIAKVTIPNTAMITEMIATHGIVNG